MTDFPDTVRYTRTHEWARQEADGLVRVGISDHAQALLGDVVYVELPEVGVQCMAEVECCVVESVKAASDVYAPIDGEVVAVNEQLADNPSLVNGSPYGEGWLFVMRPTKDDALDLLVDAKEYERQVAVEG